MSKLKFFLFQTGTLKCKYHDIYVGLGMKPPIYLKVGQVVTLGIEGLGTQRQLMVSA